MTYKEWIDNKLRKHDPFTMCAPWTTEMQEQFPELRRVRGTVLLSNTWERDHWWLESPSGEIIDPTASQFSSDYFGGARILHYAERDESQPEPTGKCPNCGDYCYDGNDCCSDACHSSYVAYLMGGRL